MVETQRKSSGAKALAVALTVFVSLGSPARAFAQTSGGAGAPGWNLPAESPRPQAPANPPPPNQRQEPTAQVPPAQQPAEPPPAEQPAPGQVEPPPFPEPRYPVTFNAELVTVHIRGPGIDKPLTCSGTCTFSLVEGVFWLDVHASNRVWTQSVPVTGAQHVVVDAPNAGVRGLGVATIIVGGAVAGGAFWIAYSISVNCGPDGPYEGSAQCRRDEDAVPYLFAGMGIGAVVAVVGVIIFVNNNKPSVDVAPALGNRARREPGTFVGLGPLEGSTLPGLTLRASF